MTCAVEHWYSLAGIIAGTASVFMILGFLVAAMFASSARADRHYGGDEVQ